MKAYGSKMGHITKRLILQRMSKSAESSKVLVATKTHDLKNWCMCDMIGLRHGTCVELVGL